MKTERQPWKDNFQDTLWLLNSIIGKKRAFMVVMASWPFAEYCRNYSCCTKS